MILGITGRIATGKSMLSTIFEEKGFIKVDADEIYSRLLENCEEMKNELLDEFKTLNRRKLFSLVSNSSKNLARLNCITHKYVSNEIVKAIENNPSEDIVLDVPIPIKRGFLDICDYIVVTDCSLDKQIDRLMKRNEIKKKQAIERISMQKNRQYYAQIANYLVITDNTVKEDLIMIGRDILNNINNVKK